MEFFQRNPNLNLLFRNRLAKVKRDILSSKNLDAIIVIMSYDSLNSINILKFSNWLMFGYSSILELEEKALHFLFNETFLIIQQDHIYVFSSNESKEFFYHLFSKIDDMTIEYDFTTKKEEANSEYIQIIKIAKFLEQTYQIKRVGVPLLKKEKNNIMEVEKWPLISAYGLDGLGEGFFTLKHEVVDISPELEKLYHVIDVPASLSLITEKSYKLETILSDFFTLFDREPIDKRLERSECSLNENQELDFLLINYSELKKTRFSYLNDLPEPRVLVGVGSNKPFDEGCSSQVIYKTLFEYNIPSFHMTYENYDATTGIRFGRTFFLSSLQREYLDYNQDQELAYSESVIYDNSYYLFNIYFKIIRYIRTHQFDIVQGRVPINEVRYTIRNQINEFIAKEYNKTENNYDYFIKDENVLVHLNYYCILGKSEEIKENKVAVLRVEVKDVTSVFTSSLIGSLLFCDSFIICNEEIFNMTHDIIPLKYFFTSNIHLTGKEKNTYDIMQLITSNSPCRYRDIEVKGLSFYHNFYNIPYLFPDSSDLGYDSNQLFLSITGKLLLFDNYIVIHDNSLGHFIIEESNVNSISYKDDIQFTILLISVKDGNKLPLSGIIKNEILLILPGKNERTKEIKYNVISFLKTKFGTRLRTLSVDKEDEYDLAVRTMNSNEYENLNYISNSFNITNIQDRLNEMYEYEYLASIGGNIIANDKVDYSKYLEIKENIKSSLLTPPPKSSTKIIFLFGTVLDSISIFSKSIQDIGRSAGIKSEIITPKSEITNNDKELFSFYYNAIVDISNKGKVLIICVQNEVKIINFLSELVSLFTNFFEDYQILNISYTINYNTFIKNKNKNLFTHLYNIVNDSLISYLFIDEGYVQREKVERNNKIITAMNPNVVVYNTRSFTRSSKEILKIFGQGGENGNSLALNMSSLQFYKDCYMTQSSKTSEEFYFTFMYRVRKELFEEFLSKSLNVPLKYSREKGLPLDPQSYMNMSDQEFQVALVEEVKRVKSKAKEPIIEKMVGFVKFLEDKDKGVDTSVHSVRACYKEEIVEKVDMKGNISTIGLLISGKNILKNIEYISEILLSLSGELPGFKNYRTKSDLTQEEIFNLNLVNFERDLPEGWTTDGPVFLDPSDNRYAHHPNLDTFINEYLVICNVAVDEHNNKVSEEINSKYLI